MTGREDYYERQSARQQRLEARAERLRREAATNYRKADLREEVSGIPFGQPILVGHHSEGKHRRAIARADAAMRRAVDATKAAGKAEAQAASVGTAGISSDAPDAVELLREKLSKIERLQEVMTAANKIVRAALRRGLGPKSPAPDLVPYVAEMASVGVTSPSAAVQLLVPDYAGRAGFARDQLTNNSAKIRDIKARIARLEAAATRETAEEVVGETRIVQNAEANRLQIFFPGKPGDDVRAALKSAGFRWSPTEGAWQRMLSNGAIYAARRIVGG